MPDASSKEPFASGQWFIEEIAEDVRVGVFADCPMSLDALKRLQALVNAKVTQMAKGVVKP
jgi:ssDNA-specific exonuclease RecJ